MSYEGFYEYLCPVGHYWSADVYDYGDNVNNCPDCGESAVWRRGVDETNGYDENDPSTMPAKLEIEQEAEYDICDRCSHRTLISERRYKIPTDQGYLLGGKDAD